MSRNRSCVIHRRRRTTSSSIIAICAAGPPIASVPSRRNSSASSRSASRRAGGFSTAVRNRLVHATAASDDHASRTLIQPLRFVIGEGVRYESSHYGITTESTSRARVEHEFHGARDGRVKKSARAVPARLSRHRAFVSPSDARAGRGGIPLRRAVHARLLADRARARRPLRFGGVVGGRTRADRRARLQGRDLIRPRLGRSRSIRRRGRIAGSRH